MVGAMRGRAGVQKSKLGLAKWYHNWKQNPIEAQYIIMDQSAHSSASTHSSPIEGGREVPASVTTTTDMGTEKGRVKTLMAAI